MDAGRIPVGYVKRPHGVRGDVLVVPLTDNPERFVPGAVLGIEESSETVTVRSVRTHNEGLILSLGEVADRNAAEDLVKRRLMIPAAERRALGEGEYWPDDLIGLQAMSPAGDALGVVSDVVLGAAQDRLVVSTPSGQSAEVPFVAELVDEPADGVIVIDAPEGLFPAT